MVTNNTSRTTWRIEGQWPGMKPVHFGFVYANSDYTAIAQARALYPWVPSWSVLRLT